MSRKTKNLSKKSKTRHTLKKSNDINVYAKNMIYMNTELIQVNNGYSIIKNNTNSLKTNFNIFD